MKGPRANDRRSPLPRQTGHGDFPHPAFARVGSSRTHSQRDQPPDGSSLSCRIQAPLSSTTIFHTKGTKGTKKISSLPFALGPDLHTKERNFHPLPVTGLLFRAGHSSDNFVANTASRRRHR